MSAYLGIDTSNYTTSCAIYDGNNNSVISKRRLLPVKSGELGLRQSDAVFHHTAALPELFDELFSEYKGETISAVGASFRPRNVNLSYMPCFTVGSSAARVISSSMNIPLFEFSHQQGHIAAAIFSSGRTDLLDKKFIAFHLSGGTTDALLVSADENGLNISQAASSLDLFAGQLVDRVGHMLSLDFPSGRTLEALALQCDENIQVKPTLKGADCCLSGVENICKKHIDDGCSKPYVARLCLRYIEETVFLMAQAVIKKNEDYANSPILFAGGVMSDCIIRDSLMSRLDCVFSQPEYSTDNAAGTAYLTYLKSTGKL